MTEQVHVWEMDTIEAEAPDQVRGRPYAIIPHIGHQEKCPVCGKVWTMRCRRDEWGFWYNSSIDQLEGHLTLLCSAECSKAYALQRLIADARDLMKTTAYQVMKLYKAGMSATQISKKLGVAESTVTCSLVRVRDFHWREWDYIQKHGEDLTA